MKLHKNFFSENIKTLFYALVIAVIIRSLLVQPFYIPSSSMEPTLLVGDRLFVTKFTYGYSKHSFPFSPPILNKRIMFSSPERGDVIVFKTPADNRTDYIKRLIGLPGDKIQFIDSNLFINSSEILKSKILIKDKIYCGNKIIDVFKFEEKLPNG
ncbi:signal peptidase I, partial [Candidatus Pelagibacter bacterium]|nr:signal peptidase I [Candidatus Pelagibacter bacterium]